MFRNALCNHLPLFTMHCAAHLDVLHSSEALQIVAFPSSSIILPNCQLFNSDESQHQFFTANTMPGKPGNGMRSCSNDSYSRHTWRRELGDVMSNGLCRNVVVTAVTPSIINESGLFHFSITSTPLHHHRHVKET